MRERYEAGEFLADIAADIGVGVAAVSSAVRRAGGEIRKRGYGARRPLYGELNHRYRGGTHERNGYRYVLLLPGHSMLGMATKRRYILEHRLVMAEAIGRALDPDETVHHIDGDGLNNDLSNLQLRRGNHGRGARWRCADCGSPNVRPQEL